MLQIGIKNGISEKKITTLLSDDFQDVNTTIQLATEKINQFVLEEDGFLKLANHFEAQLS
jgi:hypothetical protein